MYVINLVIKKQNPVELGLIQHFLHDCARAASSFFPATRSTFGERPLQAGHFPETPN